ncbi:MAG: hypothetical protein D6755_01820, partial [Anaerolineae bacterium]
GEGVICGGGIVSVGEGGRGECVGGGVSCGGREPPAGGMFFPLQAVVVTNSPIHNTAIPRTCHTRPPNLDFCGKISGMVVNMKWIIP